VGRLRRAKSCFTGSRAHGIVIAFQNSLRCPPVRAGFSGV